MDIASFLRIYPPFDALDAETLERVVTHSQIEFFPAGDVILRQGGEPARHAYVVRTGAVELIDEDRVLDLLGPGELFGHPSLTAGMNPRFTVRSHEDTLCYLVDGPVMEEVLTTQAGLTFLSASLRRRMARALEGLEIERADPWRVQVGKLIRRPLVTCAPETPVRQAAQTMTSHRVSSLLVPVDADWGIVTDRDLRSRVLAAGLALDTPVSDVMSFPARSVPAGALAPEVLRQMLELGVHHFPVVDDRGAVLGVVSDSDLMGLERRAPFTLKSGIERAPTREAVIGEGRQLRIAVCDLVDANTDPIDIGHVVGVTIDTLTRRLIELAVDELGEPPVPWAWIALGSEARHEQALTTDQDHALAYDPGEQRESDLDPYFEKLAASVTDGLEAAGIRRCKAAVSASERDWRRPIREWAELFESWMKEIGPEGAVFADIAFDHRPIAGPLDIGPRLDEIVRRAPDRPWFIRHLARQASLSKPPTGFFRDLVVEEKGEHAGTLDIKHGGITPITSIARTHALAAGLIDKGTLARLREAAAAGRIGEAERAGLEEAFRLLWQIRLEHQCAQVRRNEEPDDFVDPKTLGPLTRQGVKEAFRVIERAQRTLAVEYGLRAR